MKRERLPFTALSDTSGRTREMPCQPWSSRCGRGPACDGRQRRSLSPASRTSSSAPCGSLGDLQLVPDTASLALVDFGNGVPREVFMLGGILTTEGAPWEGCARSILKVALERLHRKICASRRVRARVPVQVHGRTHLRHPLAARLWRRGGARADEVVRTETSNSGREMP